MVDIRVGIAKHAQWRPLHVKALPREPYSGKVTPLFGTYMIVTERVERYRMTEIGLDSEENFVARSSLVDARKVIKSIAEVVHGITPNELEHYCVDSANAVLNATDIALSKVELMFIRHTSAQTNVFLDKDVIKIEVLMQDTHLEAPRKFLRMVVT
jgi:hypothetical protein